MAVLNQLADDGGNPDLKQMFDEVLSRWPRVPNLYLTLGHQPDMLKGWIDMAWALRLKAKTSRRVRELIILKGAQVSETEYEWAQHVPMAIEAGVTQSEVDALFAGEMPDSLTDAEKAAVRLADEVTAGPAASADCMEELKRHYAPSEVIELTLTACFYVCVGRTIKSLDIQLEDDFSPVEFG